MIAAFFFHLGVFEPALIGEGLKIANELEQNLGLIELAFPLGEIRQVKKDFPVNLFGQSDNFLEHHLDSLAESLFLSFLQISC
jgi:hypothetical protein